MLHDDDNPPTEPLPVTPHVSLGPYEQYSSALAAGNMGMTNGHWEDYEAQGRPGAWYIVPSKD
jgi:hypothetical protein